MNFALVARFIVEGVDDRAAECATFPGPIGRANSCVAFNPIYALKSLLSAEAVSGSDQDG
jgi:hypothetical protein